MLAGDLVQLLAPESTLGVVLEVVELDRDLVEANLLSSLPPVFAVGYESIGLAVVVGEATGVRDDSIPDPALLAKVVTEQAEHLVRLLVRVVAIDPELVG